MKNFLSIIFTIVVFFIIGIIVASIVDYSAAGRGVVISNDYYCTTDYDCEQCGQDCENNF